MEDGDPRERDGALAPIRISSTDGRANRRGTTVPARPRRRWFVDETYVKVAGRWVYLYRAIDTSALPP